MTSSEASPTSSLRETTGLSLLWLVLGSTKPGETARAPCHSVRLPPDRLPFVVEIDLVLPVQLGGSLQGAVEQYNILHVAVLLLTVAVLLLTLCDVRLGHSTHVKVVEEGQLSDCCWDAFKLRLGWWRGWPGWL